MPKRSVEADSPRLLEALAGQIKTPLIQIARLAELARSSSQNEAALQTITSTADAALYLIDSYLLSTQLLQGQQVLELEPVAVSAVLYDAAQQLSAMANEYQCELELSLSGKFEPVMAHREGLEAALVALGYVFIEAQSQRPDRRRPLLKLAAHRSRQGIVTGLFANVDGLSSNIYRRAGALYGRARQPMNEFTAASGAGIFVADSIFSAMATSLKLSHHDHLVGLAATLVPSNQLTLV